MKRAITSMIFILLASGAALAKDQHVYEKGKLTQMVSVNCGYQEKSGKGIVGELIGTDSAKRDVHDRLCQEYELKSATVVYRIRPTDEKHPALLPLGDTAMFRIKKDRLLLKAGEDEKERSYLVVSMSPVEAQAATAIAQK
jgi:hypothetical protein